MTQSDFDQKLKELKDSGKEGEIYDPITNELIVETYMDFYDPDIVAKTGQTEGLHTWYNKAYLDRNGITYKMG